jgi:hypothetical protein
MSTLPSSRLQKWFGAVFLGVTIFGCVGCQSLAPTQQQQLEAAEQMHGDVNPEYAEAAEVTGTLLYYVLQWFQWFH